LRIDGTAFFGKAGAGRIEFDGNSGIIKSGNFYYDKDDESNSNNSGMMIDLDDGIIRMFGYKGDNKNKGNVTISTQSPYFKITAYASGITGKTDGDYSLIEISDTQYIL
jgi:hypothetical protein